jgi:hypothetical protein
MANAIRVAEHLAERLKATDVQSRDDLNRPVLAGGRSR